MKKNNYLTVVDCGSSELRLGVFDNKFSKLFFKSKSISQKNNYEEYKIMINNITKKNIIKQISIISNII